MKHILFFLLYFTNITSDYGQTSKDYKQRDDQKKLFISVKIEPSFPGGAQAWQHFIEVNVDTNLSNNNRAPKGIYTVNVRFIVNTDGIVQSITCENNPGFGMCEEAVRLIKKSGYWKPAVQNGHNVNAFKRQPFIFRIE